jgi:ADP-heptose:LPS heptosyltransferase
MAEDASPPVVISPFANERVRQWPAAHFHELIGMIWREHGLRSLVVGTRAQRVSANLIVRGLSSQIVANACGTMSWREVVAAVDAAPYVVANNSGVAHLAAARGRWTLCIFAASHSPREWMPHGPFVVTVVRRLPCAPCSIGSDLCPNGVACMTDLGARDVFWRFDQARTRVLRDEPVERLRSAAP